MSRSVVQTFNFKSDDGKKKVLLIDMHQVPEETPLYKVVTWGEPLPKGDTVQPEHIHKIRTVGTGDKKTIQATRNADGKYKHYIPPEKGADAKETKPKKAKTTTTTTKKPKEELSDHDVILELKKQLDEMKKLVQIK